MQVNVNASVFWLIEHILYWRIYWLLLPYTRENKTYFSFAKSIKLTQNGFDKCVLCAFVPTLAKKVFFGPLLLVIKQKTKQETVLIRTGEKNKFRNKNRCTPNNGFSSVSIRLFKDSSGSSQQFRSIIPSGVVVVQSPLSWSSKAADCNLEPQCSWGVQAYYILLF